MKILRSLSVLLTAAVALSLSAPCGAAILQGQITDAATLLPLEGAKVTVDVSPPDGTPEFEGRTDFFGFYNIEGVPNAAVRLTASRGGYVTVQRDKSLTGDPVTENFALQRDGGPPPVDLYFTVVDASSYWPLEGVPVKVQRFNTEGAATPVETYNELTDATGSVVIFGTGSGWFEFSWNDGAARRPGWENYPKTGGFTARQQVSGSQAVNLQLKHVPQSVKLRVTGFDPRLEAEGPLEDMWVEFTGVSPDDHSVILVPPREGPADEAGEITFHNLAPLHWRIRTKRLGYVQTEEFLVPNAATDALPGGQPGAAHPVAVVIETTSLNVTLASIYDGTAFDFYEGIEIRLEGLEDSNTAGIYRELSEGAPDSERFFEGLLPGRYTISVNDTFEPDDPETTPAPHFIGETTVEVDEAEANEFEFEMDVRKAVVRARVYASETLGSMTTGGGNDLVLRRPVYTPITAPAVQLGLEADIYEAEADANGETAFHVYPGLYGFGIPALTDYYGAHIVVQRDGAAEEHRQGWPALSGQPGPRPQGGDDGEPLVVNSEREYRVDLFVHRKRVTFFLPILQTGGAPTAQLVQGIPSGATVQCSDFSELSAVPPEITLTKAGGVSIAGTVVRRGGQLVAEFEHVTPGTWTWSGTHPRFNLSSPEFIPGMPTQTVTVPDWPAAPGGNYTGPGGGFFSLFQQVIPYQNWPTAAPCQAEYKATGAISITRKIWNEELDPPEYEDQGTNNDPVFDFIRPAYAGGATFCNARRPLGDFALWIKDTGGWFTSNVSGDEPKALTIYLGGPQNNITQTAPSVVANVTLRAVSREAPDAEIPGISFTMAGGQVFAAGTLTVPAQYNGALSISGITDPAGRWLMVGQQRATSGVWSQNLTLTAELKRALNISGTVKVNNTAAEPIPNAKVRLRDRFGDARFPARQTNKDGQFTVPPTPETPVFFADVTAPGFIPKRLRFAGNDPAIGGTGNNGSLVLDIRLDPLPLPVVTATMDRYGLFVTNLSYSHNAPLGTSVRATEALTATWNATITPPPGNVTYEEIPFDNPDGTPGEPVTRTLHDEVLVAAIVDPRLFPPQKSEEAGNGAPGAPEESQFLYNPDPDPAKVLARRKWWDSITSQEFADAAGAPLAGWNVLWSLAADLQTGGATSQASGSVKLWSIPPGVYRPVVVVETKHGAVGMFQIKYEGADAYKNLRSLRPPPTIAFLADFLAFMTKFSSSPARQERIQEKTQSGRLIPKRARTALIQLDPANPGFLTYEYDINAVWKEGPDAPGTGIIGLVAGQVGGIIEAGVNLKISGRDGKVTLDARGEATKDKVSPGDNNPNATQEDKDRFKPKALSAADKRRLKLTMQVTGGANTILSEKFDENLFPLETLIRQRFIFAALTEARYNLKPYAKFIPYVGPVVRGLDRINQKIIKVDAVGRVGIGLESLSSWTTKRTFPPGSGSVIGGAWPHPELGHSLGGSQERPPAVSETNFAQEFGLCFNVGLGGEVSAGNAVGGSLFFNLEGPDCTIPIGSGVNRPAMSIVVGGSNGWPTLERASGEVNVTLNLFLDVWLTRFEKKIQVVRAPFSYQLGTESILSVLPMSVTLTRTVLTEAEPVDFRGTAPQVTGNILNAGTVRLTGGGAADVMIFASPKATGGRMELKAAVRTSPTAWGAPVNIVEADGIVAADVARLSDGSLLAVWSEIATAEAANPFAASTVRSARSTDNGATWSAPVVAATPDRVADSLFLETSGTLTALIVVTAEGGPDSLLRRARRVSFTVAGGWSAVNDMAALQEMRGFDASSCAGGVVLAWVNAAGELRVATWTGGATVSLASGAGGLSGNITAVDSSGACVIAAPRTAGGIATQLLLGTTLLTATVQLPNESAAEVTALPVAGGLGRVLLIWSDSASGALRSGVVEGFGQPGTPAVIEIAAGAPGRYQPLDVLLSPAGHATVFARHVLPGAAPQLRQFVTTLTGAAAHDDRDGDGMSDRAELRIVDADAEDAFVWIDDVLPGADFDGDGANNGEEIAAGNDPVDPTDRPIPSGVTVAGAIAQAQEFGLVPAVFIVTRSDATAAADVAFALSGSATTGTDFTLTETSPLHFAAGEASKTITLLPVSDSSPEGMETVTLTLQPGAGYTLGTPSAAQVSIADRPSDQWRLAFFPGNPAGTPFTGDTDGDGVSELAEFGLALDPHDPDASGLPEYGTTADGNYLTLTYVRPVTADLTYTVEVAPNLTSWQSGPAITAVVSSVENGDGTRTVTVRSLTPIAALPGQMMRLRITRGP